MQNPVKLSSFSYSKSTNIGDEIQTIAAMHAIKKLGYSFDGFVDRNDFTPTRDVSVLMNGFFHADELPRFLDERVRPIVSNIHISRHPPLYRTAPLAVDAEPLRGYHAFEPLGVRDRATLALLQGMGFDAFFNYCLTLTFDKRAASITGDRIFIVDLDNMLPLPKHIRNQHIEYINQDSPQIYSHETKMAMAGELLERYRTQAKLVITSKLHCALPCIAMGIPVIFFADDRDERLHLVREFIPIHPYIAIESEHAAGKIFPTPDKARLKVFWRRNWRKIWYHLRYRRAWKRIDWSPAPVDVTEVKKTILGNLKRMIEKTP